MRVRSSTVNNFLQVSISSVLFRDAIIPGGA